MKRSVTVAIGIAAVSMAGSGLAGKVNIPKEGNYEFEFCLVGQAKNLSADDKVFVAQYSLLANLKSSPPGRAFDRMGAVCYGLYTNWNGRQQEAGVCELTDLDGDKWWMDYHGNADGAGGSYTAAHGTGKYDGITLKGEYHIDNAWGSASKEVSFQGCNPNKGTYKLK